MLDMLEHPVHVTSISISGECGEGKTIIASHYIRIWDAFFKAASKLAFCHFNIEQRISRNTEPTRYKEDKYRLKLHSYLGCIIMASKASCKLAPSSSDPSRRLSRMLRQPVTTNVTMV